MNETQSDYFRILRGWAQGVCPTSLADEVVWEQKYGNFYGKTIALPRLTAFYADGSHFSYVYSGIKNSARLWTPLLRVVRDSVSQLCGIPFNSCLLNLYCDGSDYVGWHADDENTAVEGMPVASLSLGATRLLGLRPKRDSSNERAEFIELRHGDLMVMDASFQRELKHSLRPDPSVTDMRVNLTFRCFYPEHLPTAKAPDQSSAYLL